MQKLPINNISRCLDISAVAPKESIFCFIGSQGLGKTACIKQWCDKNKRRLVPFSLVQRGPIELSGMFMPDDKSKKMKIYDCETLSSLTNKDVLFFDELFESSPEVQAACLTILQERELLSGKKLPDNLIICAATNRSASPESIKDNFKDRFEFVEVEFDFDDWKNWVEDKLNVIIPKDIYLSINTEDKTEVWNVNTPRTVYKWIVRWINSNDTQRHFMKKLLNTNGNILWKYLEQIESKPDFNTVKDKIILEIRTNLNISQDIQSICEDIIKAETLQQIWECINKLSESDLKLINDKLKDVKLEEIRS